MVGNAVTHVAHGRAAKAASGDRWGTWRLVMEMRRRMGGHECGGDKGIAATMIEARAEGDDELLALVADDLLAAVEQCYSKHE